ncbi:hypothetical protein EY01_15715, partial [Staphylococcus aureus]
SRPIAGRGHGSRRERNWKNALAPRALAHHIGPREEMRQNSRRSVPAIHNAEITLDMSYFRVD